MQRYDEKMMLGGYKAKNIIDLDIVHSHRSG
jgi:hypothetical protein